MTIQIHTITSIQYASADDGPEAPCIFTWTDGRTETHPKSWRGFFRGVVGGRNGNGDECEWRDGTGMNTRWSVVDALEDEGGAIAAYEPPPPPEEPEEE
jgi:hypothetical protein